MDSKNIGRFIAIKRKSLSMTQQDLADKLNITNRAVSKWETGEGYPDITVLPSLAKILGVTVDELLDGKQHFRNPHNNKNNTNIHFSNLYLICIGVLLLSIVLSLLSLRLYNGVWLSLGSPLLISVFSLIGTIVFFGNLLKNYTANAGLPVKSIYKKHLLFWFIYALEVTICVCVIPLWHFVIIGYYRVFHELYGYNSFGRFVLDMNLLIIISILIYCVLTVIGAFVIKRKYKQYKNKQVLNPVD